MLVFVRTHPEAYNGLGSRLRSQRVYFLYKYVLFYTRQFRCKGVNISRQRPGSTTVVKRESWPSNVSIVGGDKSGFHVGHIVNSRPL